LSDSLSIQSIYRTYTATFIDDFRTAFLEVLRPGDVVITDRIVREINADTFASIPSDVRTIAIDANEEQKSYERLAWIIELLIEGGFKKNNRLVAVGGGIVQDVTAFIASILYRGVEWIFFPSTLLAQCDSCIGSKTSINFGKYKNQIGNFYPPSEIHICPAFLDSLPDIAIRSGIGEMIHYFLVAGDTDYRMIRSSYHDCMKDPAIMRRLILRSLEIKKSYIERDEFDKGPRQVFNYGHSFGHAIESVTQYAVPHGVAVSFGMDIANFISARLGLISDTLRGEVRELLVWNWQGSSVDGLDVRAFEKALSKDKKNVGNELRVILTKGLGDMFKSPLPLDSKTSSWFDEWFRDWRNA